MGKENTRIDNRYWALGSRWQEKKMPVFNSGNSEPKIRVFKQVLGFRWEVGGKETPVFNS